MTWQMASFALLALTLAAGLAWYERTHPSSKVLALVATLAALAALGRIAFAPLPSVKPTTDIVLIAGYVLGGAPGFAVGAVAAVASGFFFGHGPYTPWQMVGWGAVGLFGAGLAAVFGRELGRWALALACGAAGLAYGLFMDFHLWVTYSAHSLGELGVIAGRGVPFNVTHAVANVAFFLAFGPMLVRALRRFRDRFDVTWRPAPARAAGAGLGVVLAAAVVAASALALAGGTGGPAVAEAAASKDRAVTRGVAYLRAAQTRDGGYAERRGGRRADAIASGWAPIAIAASGRDPGRRAARYAQRMASRVTDVGDMERALLALHATRRPTGALLAKLDRKRERDGSFEGLTNRTAFALLAYKAAGRKPPERTVRWLLDQQNDDGGWSVGGKDGMSGVDDTATVVQGLVAAGRKDDPAIERAVRWLTRRQGPDGGFPLTPGAPSNAQSTAFVMQALVAAGHDVDRVRRNGSRTPRAYLRSLQASDGSFRYSRTSRQTPTWVTAQVVAALTEKPLPVRGPRAKASNATGLRAFTALVLGALL
jgi:energy-coupling factor transport system substrate-specific component